MKLGVREICDVVIRAKSKIKIGSKTFYAGEPVLYFDTLKTSSLEGAAQTVYAQGGRGNARLVAWEGERTVTFTMEDALISPESFMILSGAGLIEAGQDGKTLKVHTIENTDDFKFNAEANTLTVWVKEKPYLPTDKKDNFAYIMAIGDDEGASEPFIPTHGDIQPDESHNGKYKLEVSMEGHTDYVEPVSETDEPQTYTAGSVSDEFGGRLHHVLVDYYTEKASGVSEISIEADKFGGNYYLEASTLFRNENGVDLPAEFIIPNCKIQSNFSFTMASTGDPSTFTFTMDAFPDYTRFDHSKKVLAVLQIVSADNADLVAHRTSTIAAKAVENA